MSKNTEPRWRRGLKLVNTETGEEIALGSKVKTFRGEEVEVVDFYAKEFPSTGRAVVKFAGGWEQAYYPSVINAAIVERKI